MRSVLQLAPLAALSIATLVGCTVTTSDAPLDGGGTVTDTGAGGVDSATDTGVIDTGAAVTDTGGGAAVIIPAKSLVSSSTMDDIHDFGGGSTRSDIAVGGRIAYATAVWGTFESKPFGDVDGRLVGLPTGTELVIEVTGFLRGLNGDNDAKPSKPIPWASATCRATPTGISDVIAKCDKPLALKPELKGIVISSDVLPAGWCTGKGKTTFQKLRARTPFTGAATVSKTVDDCLGVIWLPFSEFSAVEDASGKSEWGISVETSDSTTACSLMAPCKVDRMLGSASPLDIFVVGDGCKLDDTTAPRTPACF